jgi:hypothetical protein
VSSNGVENEQAIARIWMEKLFMARTTQLAAEQEILPGEITRHGHAAGHPLSEKLSVLDVHISIVLYPKHKHEVVKNVDQPDRQPRFRNFEHDRRPDFCEQKII